MFRSWLPTLVGVWVGLLTATVVVGETKFASHPPMRALPTASQRPMSGGPARFVDARGNDEHDGSEKMPWKTVVRAVRQLQPGDTLYLRGGIYYESLTLALHGTPEQPITIRSYPGESAIVDAGLREFWDDPAAAWEPVPDGAPGEYRSTKTYPLGGGFGNFGDSMVPFHRYLNFYDLRSTNEFYFKDFEKRGDDPRGIYCGPGTIRDPATGRIHIRLAHTQLPGLGDSGYRGETDPRKLRLVVAGHDYGLKIEGARHLRVQDLVVRGAQRTAVEISEHTEDVVQDSEDIVLDGLTLYGSGSALRTDRVRGLKVVNCAFRGHAAPWHSRAHHKYRAHAGYLFHARGDDIEIAHCELTDHHDGLQTYFADELRFHHNLVDNFNDDGIEPGPKRERGKVFIYQNLISRCLNPFTLHGDNPIPVDTQPGHGVYIYRNIVDLRRGTYRTIPADAAAVDTTGEFLNSPTILLAHDHGGPVHPIYYVYHNTFLLPDGLFRNLYLYGWSHGTRMTTRRVFNNIFVQVDGLSTQRVLGLTADQDFQADGNLMWSLREGEAFRGDYFEKLRASPVFVESKKQYAPGWSAHDRFADPKFERLDVTTHNPVDLRLQSASPAKDAGVAVPGEWPDPLREQDRGKPDLGALPDGAEPLVIGLRKSR